MDAPLFTLIFLDRTQTRVGRCQLPWVKGKEVRHYMREGELKEMGLVGLSQRCKLYNQEKQLVRISYTPRPNDFVVMVPTGRAER